MNVLFCNIAWMKYYEGMSKEDKRPNSGGSYVVKNGFGHEEKNFKNYNGRCYGFVYPNGEKLNLYKNFKGATKNSTYVDDVLVVWCATSEEKGNVIIGWYKNARVYTLEQSKYIERERIVYRMEANFNDCYLIPEEQRDFKIGRVSQVGTGKGFGQSNVWYASAEVAKKEVVPKVLEYIENFKNENLNIDLEYDEITDDILHYEGSVTTIKVNRYERNQDARKKCIEIHGCQCKICGFDFEKTYGKAGKGLIHVHHVVPISSIKEEYQIDYENDLIPVCPNCHAMIHRKKIPYSINEVREMLTKL